MSKNTFVFINLGVIKYVSLDKNGVNECSPGTSSLKL